VEIVEHHAPPNPNVPVKLLPRCPLCRVFNPMHKLYYA
jgi:hypothetical protein